MMIRSTPWLLGFGTLFLAELLAPVPTPAQSARDIMQTQHDLHIVGDETETQKMTLVNKNGETKEREVLRYTITGANDLSKILLRFTSPRDIEGTSMLTWEKQGGDDDQWLYLPAMRKVKRIASSGKKNRFMGTDFSYDDLQPENMEANTYALAGSENLDGHDCWVIEAVPATDKYARDSGYSKRKLWIRKDNHVTVKREFYDKRNKLEKVQVDRKISKATGTAWRSDEVEMRDVQAGTKTIFVSTSRTLNERLRKDLFTLTELEEGAD